MNEAKQMVSVQLSSALAAAVRVIAQREEESLSTALRRLIRRGIEIEQKSAAGQAVRSE